VVTFCNGIPVGLFELKSSADENATLKNAWNQIQTYRKDIPALFTPNVVTVISDGVSAAMSAFSGRFEHYAPWKTIDGPEPIIASARGLGETEGSSFGDSTTANSVLAQNDGGAHRYESLNNAGGAKPALEVLVKGVFDPGRFLDLMRNFVLYSDERNGLVKKVAKYHQFWAVNTAVESTVRAASEKGDRRAGVVWHTQGSGKSIEMLLYAAKIMRDPRMGNPTLVFITDRNDLDDQLFGEVFAPLLFCLSARYRPKLVAA
jgi:type I restriction enzyme R subunit